MVVETVVVALTLTTFKVLGFGDEDLKLLESTDEAMLLMVLEGLMEAKFLLMTLDASLSSSSSDCSSSLSGRLLLGGATFTSTLSEAEGSFRPNSTLDVSKYLRPKVFWASDVASSMARAPKDLSDSFACRVSSELSTGADVGRQSDILIRQETIRRTRNEGQDNNALWRCRRLLLAFSG